MSKHSLSADGEEGSLLPGSAAIILEDYLAGHFPHFDLKPSRLIGDWLSCELRTEFLSKCDLHCENLGTAISALWDDRSEVQIKLARDTLFTEGAEIIVFWITAEHLKAIKLLYGTLVVNPVPLNITLEQYCRRNDEVRFAIIQRACDIVCWITERPLVEFRKLGIRQTAISDLCRAIKANSADVEIKNLNKYVLKAEQWLTAWMAGRANEKYMTTLDFLIEKSKSMEDALKVKRAFDKRVERHPDQPQDFKIQGSSGKKGIAANPNRYLRGYLEIVYSAW